MAWLRRLLSWILVALVGGCVYLSLHPEVLPVAQPTRHVLLMQLVALRSPMALGWGILCLIFGLSFLISTVRSLRRWWRRRAEQARLAAIPSAWSSSPGHFSSAPTRTVDLLPGWEDVQPTPATTRRRRLHVHLSRALVVACLCGYGAWQHGQVLWQRGFDNHHLSAAPAAPAANTPGDSSERTLTVLEFNALKSKADRSALAQAIETVGADVVVLPETAENYASDLVQDLRERGLRYTSFTAPGMLPLDGLPASMSQQITATSVLLSERMGPYEAQFLGDTYGHGAALLTARGHDGGDGSNPAAAPPILAVHTMAPVTGRMDMWESNLRDLVAVCNPETIPAGLIIAGDFNATLDHEPMTNLGQCTDAAVEARIGGFSTWPTLTHTPLIGSTIDHVLIDSATWQATAGEIVDIPGSDHRAVVVRLHASRR